MRLITRLDFDGLVCAAMIYKMERIEELQFANPKDIEEGRIDLDPGLGDAIVHLPFHPFTRLWFHHHDFENIPAQQLENVRGKWGPAPSTAQLVYDFYASSDLDAFKPLVEIANNIGAVKLAEEDVISPKGWMLVNYVLDPRFPQAHDTGVEVLQGMRLGKKPEEILQSEHVKSRVDRYFQDLERFKQELTAHTTMEGNVILTDFREYDDPPRGNRFLPFLKFPEGNVWVRIDKHRDPMKLLISASKSPFNKTCTINIGKLMEENDGGGLEGAGTCPASSLKPKGRLETVINALKQ